jgi:hydrogenase expression/formation protein HypD
MKYIDEYRQSDLVKQVAEKINKLLEPVDDEIVIMEVCGTHTQAIFRAGLRVLLSSKLRLLSGPGCPVCVTPTYYLDKAIAYAREADAIITTFGDMLRVPGSSSSLEKEKASGRDIRIVYSVLDALKIAQQERKKKVIFLGVGFETTAPTTAVAVKIAREEKIENFFVFSSHKLIPPALEALVTSKELGLHGFICPGHVSTIIGSEPYEVIASEYNISCVITGFEPLDIVQGIYLLVAEITQGGKASVKIQYRRSVKKEGNPKALALMKEVFEITSSNWRGIGEISKSGLKIGENYAQFDIEKLLDVEVEKTSENKECICGEILRGLKTPLNCRLFRKVCSPANPIGACMVSSEGTCSAYYKYSVSER